MNLRRPQAYATLIAWLVVWTPVARAAEEAPFVIADFEGPSALDNWHGPLSLGPGHRGQGAVLTYRSEAVAMWQPVSPLPKRHNPAISFWIRFQADTDVFLVAKDTSGGTFQFPVRTTLEHPKAGGWQYVVAPLSTKGRLAEVGIRVQPRGRQTPESSVTFDDIELRESAEPFRLDPGAEVAPPLRERVELGVNIHLLRDDPALDLAHSAGFQFVRMDMLWANVERAGRYRFFAYDGLLRALDARGMGVLWILDYGHPDHGGSTPRTPQDIAAFGRFAEAAAAHFKGRNVRYEIWNEPNTSQFWTPAPNPSEYASLLREAVASIHRADPEAKVLSGGLSRLDATFLSRSVDPALAASLAAIGIHPYPQNGPESIAPDLGALRDWVARVYGERLELWDTEWGYSSANSPKEAPSNGHTESGRKRQAVLAVREILTVWNTGLPLAVYYDLRDDGTDPANPEHNYGLLDSSGNEKPAMRAIHGLMDAVKSRKVAGMVRPTPEGIHAMRLDGADTLFMVWTDQAGGRRRVEYPKGDLISVTDLWGKAVKTKDGSAGRARTDIEEAGGPIFFVYRRSASLGAR